MDPPGASLCGSLLLDTFSGKLLRTAALTPQIPSLPHPMTRPADFRLSVVVPCYNEQEVICETHRRLTQVLGELTGDYEILYVDDGSGDETPGILARIQAGDSHVRMLRFSRNFGHQIAVTAGMEHATGDAVILIDADLQDPPEVMRDFVNRWRVGFDVVYAQRIEREGETLFKRASAAAFYRGLRLLTPLDIPPDTGDFRLIDRAVVDALNRMPEKDRFIRGLVSWAGFRQTSVLYRRAPRFAGTSKYPFWKMARLAADAVIAFSPLPLRLASFAGLAGFLGSGVGLGSVILDSFGETPPAFELSLLFLILAVASGQLMALGLLGEYVGRIFRQVRARPLYLIAESRGFSRGAASINRAA